MQKKNRKIYQDGDFYAAGLHNQDEPVFSWKYDLSGKLGNADLGCVQDLEGHKSLLEHYLLKIGCIDTIEFRTHEYKTCPVLWVIEIYGDIFQNLVGK